MTEKDMLEWLRATNAAQKYPRNNIGESAMISDLFRNTHRFCATAKDWYKYTGSVWQMDVSGLDLRNDIKKFATALNKYALRLNDEDYFKYTATWMNYQKRNVIINDARDNYSFSLAECDADDYVLNLPNGHIKLTNNGYEYLPSNDPDMLCTMMAGASYQARRCERWETFVSEIMQGDTSKILYLQELAGLCLSGDVSPEKMWFLYGATTRNGKSTFLETVCKALGTYSTTIRPETLAMKQNADSRTASPDVAKLAGKRLVTCAEFPKKMPVDTALLKSLTGGDSISARFLHQGEFEFKPKFKLLVNTNHLPVVSDSTVFASDRMQVVTFNRHFSEDEQDKNLKRLFSSAEALSGVLWWCLQGWSMYVEEGLEAPTEIKQATTDYAASSDKIANFIEDCLIQKAGYNLPVKVVYEIYDQWCNDYGYYTENKGNFISDMKSRGMFKTSGTLNGRTVRNVIHGFELAENG